ncbi:MAG: hypothetical protein H0T73_04710 [Ardenticatenales bacterium]|nr:hypothetical protein [Ardenticatenales bacterium]
MDIEILQRQFNKIGALLKVDVAPKEEGWRFPMQRSRRVADFLLDVREVHGRETFLLTVHEEALDTEFLPIDVRPHERHLLLLARTQTKQKFLCGHDERHWFVAPVPEARSVTTVADAMDALKPQAVVTSQREHGVKGKNWNRRHNEGFIRQGEWFFLPRPRFHPDNELMILHNEPIRRSGGSPHMVEWLYRSGGTTVYVCNQHPNGLTEPQYQAVIRQNPKATKWAWRVMQRNPQVYAMGKIRHRDHATVKLLYWHLVVMSGETRSGNVVFLD